MFSSTAFFFVSIMNVLSKCGTSCPIMSYIHSESQQMQPNQDHCSAQASPCSGPVCLLHVVHAWMALNVLSMSR